MKSFGQKFKTFLIGPRKILLVLLLFISFVSLPGSSFAITALIYYCPATSGGWGAWNGPWGSELQADLAALGYTVTFKPVCAVGYNPIPDNWNAYDQVWDVRFMNNQTACGTNDFDSFGANWQTAANTYVGTQCGNLYLLGENAGFSSRNDQLGQYLVSAGAVAAGFTGCLASPNGSNYYAPGGAFTVSGLTAAGMALPGGPTQIVTWAMGGIPLGELNGTDWADWSTWTSIPDGVTRSFAAGWSGKSQLKNYTGCNVGKLAMVWDDSMWQGDIYVGGNVAITDKFFKGVAQWLGAAHTCAGCNTPTNTPTNTFTATFTNTFTKTPTPTFTDTFTNTDTPTPTNTKTATPTDTNTFTNTYTPTFTNTFTPTATPTFTNTFTNTFTATFTNTPTNTFTPTPTFTNTFMNTPTFTNTFTDTPTDTFTDTVTNTFTQTPTNTPTNTVTATPTFTATFTNTFTNTVTNTNTPTNTFTSTFTNTPIFTFTFTNTYTNTFTSTPTSTPTNGISMGKHVSKTEVHPGDTLTYAIGVTVVGNNVIGPVITDTLPAFMTFIAFGSSPAGTTSSFNSGTDQLQWVLPSPLAPGTYTLTYSTTLGNFAPANMALTNFAQLNYLGSNGPLTSSVPVTVIGEFTVKINIYNEAGEVVKTITIQNMTQPVSNISLSTTNTITTLKGPGSSVNIIFNGYVIGTWDGTNNSGLPVTNGQYKVQVDNIGQSGVVTSVSQNVTVNRKLSNITASVFNGAGELVRTLYYMVDDPMGSSMTNVLLSSNVIKPNISAPVTNGSPHLATVYIQTSGTPVTLVWDGTDNGSSVVTPGEYTIQVHWNNGSGQTTDISRQILVMPSVSGNGIAIAKPNILSPATSMTTTFDATGVQNVSVIKVRIYTVAGELVQAITSAVPQAVWTASGVASGIYIVNVEMDNANSGVVNHQFLKVLVLH